MKAVLCRAYGPPESLVVADVPSPAAGPGEVVVSVKAASLNFPDLLIVQNKYQFKPRLPFSPGSELAGVVKAIGEGVTSVRPGDRVMAFTTYGAFAEEVKIEAHRLFPIPQGMDDVTASALMLTYGTSDHALRDRGDLKAGETLLVLGAAGGVGISAIEIGKAVGARVIACASTDEKLSVCRAHGADDTINYARGCGSVRLQADLVRLKPDTTAITDDGSPSKSMSERPSDYRRRRLPTYDDHRRRISSARTAPRRPGRRRRTS